MNLLRWRLQDDLDYKITHPLTLTNATGSPVYTMVFATDHRVGSNIMHDIYSHAYVHEIPELRGLALAHRAKVKQEAQGITTLFEQAPTLMTPTEYEHTEPWKPPERCADDTILDAIDEYDDPDDYGEFDPENF